MINIIKDNDFVCRCSEGEAQRCDDILKEAKSKLNSLNDLEFIDDLFYALGLDGDISFMADQWGGWGYDLYSDKIDPQTDKIQIKASCFIQCDRPVDGLAAVYLWKESHK